MNRVETEPKLTDIIAAVERHVPRDLPERLRLRLVPSAVIIPLYEREGQVHIMFTRRSDMVSHHKGQISFPGGRRDPEDCDLAATALREFEEEMGLMRTSVRLIGRLDEQAVISNYRIAPFVGIMEWPFETVHNGHEIASVLHLRLSDFLRPELHSLSRQEFEGRIWPIHYFDIDGNNVWGATGRIMADLLHIAFDYRPPEYEKFLAETGRI